MQIECGKSDGKCKVIVKGDIGTVMQEVANIAQGITYSIMECVERKDAHDVAETIKEALVIGFRVGMKKYREIKECNYEIDD